jgi:hypothetical protein
MQEQAGDGMMASPTKTDVCDDDAMLKERKLKGLVKTMPS